MNNTTPRERAAEFIAALRRIQTDRGKMAALRRGFSSTTVMDAWPVLAGLGGNIGNPGESVHLDIAALFAFHPVESKAFSFGQTCREIALADSSDGTPPDNYERRFRRLLSCSDARDLSDQLRTWVRLAASKNVGVNYESLFQDLLRWPWRAEDIRVQWAKSFWQQSARNSEAKREKEAKA